MRRIIFSIMFVMLISLVGASSLGPFSQNTPGDLTIVLLDVNGTTLDTNTITRLTIFYPNGTIFLKNESMSWNENYFNYTLNTSQTSIIGTYDGSVEFENGAAFGFTDFDFLINLGGIAPSEARAATITRSVYFIFILGLVLFFAFLFTNKKMPIKLTLLLLSGLAFLISMNIIFLDLQDTVVNPSVISFFSSFTAISFYIYWGIGMGIGVLWIVTLIMTIVGRRTKQNLARFE